jgi:protein AFG1
VGVQLIDQGNVRSVDDDVITVDVLHSLSRVIRSIECLCYLPTCIDMSKSALEAAYKGLLTRNRLRPDTHQQALVRRLASLQDELANTNHAPLIPRQQPSISGLYIYGSVGTGKSRIADLFTATLPQDITRRRVHFHEFMNDIHHRLHIARQSPNYRGDPLIQIGKTIRQESRVLCFDEFQLTDIADAMIMARLFGSIWREGGVMVSTSNRHPNGLYENGLNRDIVMPFIREVQRRCEVWEIGGREDYRMASGAGGAGGEERAETFLTDESLFQERLEETMGGNRLEPVSLSVYGSRKIEVQAVAAASSKDDSTASPRRLDLVSGTFAQFCDKSLGAADYHALCSSASTIFISGLRQFQSIDKDRVRRFITLIDLAYEKGTRVICHSTVPLGEVFVNIVPVDSKVQNKLAAGMRVKAGGGASSSMMSTFIGETEWSATGLAEASLATGGAGESDVGFAVGRAISRLYEMGSAGYGVRD